MSDKNYRLKVDVEGASDSLQLAIERLEKIESLKSDIAKQVELVNDSDIKKITELGKSIEQVVVAEKKQKEAVDEQTKALEKLLKAQQAEAIELEGLKVLTQQQNKENKEAAKEALGLTTEYERQSKQLNELKRQAKGLLAENRALTKSELDLVKAAQELDKKLKEVDKSVGDNQRNVGDYRGQLKLLQKELQGLEPGTAQFTEAAKRAGELKDRIKDATEATNAFATGSKLEQFGNIFKDAGSDILKLDFAGAAEKARTLVAVTKGITFKDALTGVKDLGSSIVNLGKAIITNPLFLIAGVATAIGVALFKLKDDIPFLGAAFDAIGKTIDSVIQVFKDLGDAIGLTNYAVRDSTKAIIESQEEYIDQIKKSSAFQAALAKAQGKNAEQVAAITIAANEKIIESGKKKLKAIESQLAAENKLWEEDTEEQKKFREEVRAAEEENQILRAQILTDSDNEQIAENKKRREDEQKENERIRKENEKKYSEESKRNAEAFADRQKRLFELQEKINKAQEEQDQFALNEAKEQYAKELEEQEAFLKNKEAADKASQDRIEKERLERLKTADQIASAIDKALDERSKKNIENIANEEKAADKSLALQEKRAAEGLANTLEFEQEKAAKIEIEKEKQAKKDQRREKILTFYSLLSGYAKDPGTSPSQALLRAGKDMATAEGISLAFAEKGGVGEDLKDTTTLKSGVLSKSHKSGDILTVISPNEGILNENQMSALGGKKGFYNLTSMLENPISDDIMFPAVPEFSRKKSSGLAPLVREMREVKQAVENIKISNSYIDNVGNVITENINGGFKKITKKISSKPSFRR